LNTPNGSDHVSFEATVAKVGWRLMPLLMICYLFALFDRINISFAKFQLQSDLGFSDTAYGLGAGLFTVGYVLFELPSNMILYRVGARRWIARIMISWGLATAAMVFVTTEREFYALRFIIGSMEAGFAPGVLYYLTIWFPVSHRGRITSLLYLALACSGMLGAPFSGLVLDYLNGIGGLRGWHWLFLLGGLPCVALGIIVLRRLDDRISDARWLTDAEKQVLAEHIEKTGTGKAKHGSLREAIRTSGFLVLGLVYFLIQIGSYGLHFWAPHMIRAAGIENATAIGFLTAVPYFCGAVGMVVIGHLSDATGERAKFLAGLLILGSMGFLAAGIFDKQPVLLIVSLAVIGAGVVSAIPTFWFLPPKLLVGAGAASGIALINTTGHLAGIVCPPTVGAIRDLTGSTTPALYLISGAILTCAGILLFALPSALRAKDE
jgi:MFS family permease